jgi:aminoglycoside phosphotransferase (APT) family kinase protein
MHDGELDLPEGLVRRLIAAQFPAWADLPVRRVASNGTDNAMFRLGRDMAVRMPRIPWAVGQVEKEQRWLPLLAGRLPLDVPTPLALGEPGEGYPWRWSVYRWLKGTEASGASMGNPVLAARDLAGFIRALQRIEAAGGPPPGEHNSRRGVDLRERDEAVRKAIAVLENILDVRAVSAAWEAALAAPEWDRPPAWIHGDLAPGNLLVRRGRLRGVIDFGCLAVGDPASDLIPAWNWFSGEARQAFQEALDVDDATWQRGKGWALSQGLIAVPYYMDTNPALAELGKRSIARVLADSAAGGGPRS